MATAYDVLLGIVFGVWIVIRYRVAIVHARSYVPAVIAIALKRLTGVKFLFDMRGFWADERVDGGLWPSNGRMYRVAKWFERRFLLGANHVISLSHSAVRIMKGFDYLQDRMPPFTVIPTCADLDRFMPAGQAPARRIIGCLGTVLSGWFRLDWLASFLSVAATRDDSAVFELTTRDDPARVCAALDPDGRLGERLRIAPSAPEDVQKVLQRQTASVMFFTDGLSKLGSSPTRMAEILGCGLPVVAYDGVGDVARIIREYRVGVLAAGAQPEAMAALLKDPELASRCRKAAEEIFSLESGTAAYARLYEQVLEGEHGCAA